MSNYVKLYDGFWRGSMRDEPPYTRLLFLAMLSLADENGVVHGTNGFLASFAGISLQDVEDSLKRLQQPDPESTSQELEGRRIVRYGSGSNRWLVVNYKKYYERSRQIDRAENKREWDRLNRPSGHARNKQSDTVRHSPNSPTQSEQSDPNLKELNLEELNLENNPPIIPPSLDTKEFRKAWDLWMKHRTEIKKPLKPTTIHLQIKKLEEMGVERAIRALQHSIENGWQGIFEPKPDGNSRNLITTEMTEALKQRMGRTE